MDKQLFQNIPVAERREMLAANADRQEETSYVKSFTADEIVTFKHELSDVAIEISDLTDQKKAATKEFDELMKPSKDRHKELLTFIRQKGQLVKEDCFVLLEREEGMAGVYNAEGTLIFSRPMTPEEKQLNAFTDGQGIRKIS